MRKKKKPKLSPLDKTVLGRLSRTEVERTVAGLKPFLKRSLWIGSTNHYVRDVVQRLEKAVPTTVERKRNLAQYIAASVALHANDGWSYLGRAVGCLLSGDTRRALHLAYYAELRAAMSLLASAGVGIFSNQHFIITGVNSTSKLRAGNGTHIMAWLALEEWSRRPASGELFSALVRPEGRSLDDWFQPQGGTSALAPQAKAWFMQWGMDLGLASKDREARNESSYRPDGIPTSWEVNAKDGLEFVRDMWGVLEPSANSSFEQLDRHILRLAIESYHHGLTGRLASATDAAFVTLVDSIVNAQSLAAATEERLKRFLLRQAAPDDPQLFRYSAMKPGNPRSDAFAVTSRAVLLLRIATGSAQHLLSRAGIDAGTLGFWWQRLGEARGLWRPGSPPSPMSDLWAEVDEALREVAGLEAADPGALGSFHSIAARLPSQLNVFTSHERVGLWGLCPA